MQFSKNKLPSQVDHFTMITEFIKSDLFDKETDIDMILCAAKGFEEQYLLKGNQIE